LRKLGYLLFLLTIPILSIAQGEFKVYAETKQALAGSSFRIEFRLENAEGRNFSPPDFGGLKLLSGPSRSMQTSIINGHTQYSTGYVYILAGTRPGKYRIGAASIAVGSLVLKTKPLEIEILSPSSKAGQAADYFVRAELSSKKAYTGQQVLLTYRLFTRVSIDNIEVVSSPDLDPFYRDYIATGDGDPKRVVEKGVEYQTKVLGSLALYPLRPGKYRIEGSAYRLILGEDDPWGFGMSSMFNRRAEVTRANDLDLEVLDIPKPVPDGFTGAVGYFFTEIKDIPEQYNMSDAISIEMTLSGTGHFPSIRHQLMIPDSSFQITEGKPAEPMRIGDDSLVIHSTRISYLLTPKRPGHFTLYPEFIYLDPDSGKYISRKDTLNINILNDAPSKDISKGPLTVVSDFRLSKSSHVLFRQSISWIILMLPALLALGLWIAPGLRDKWISKRNEEKSAVGSEPTGARLAELNLVNYLRNKYPDLQRESGLFEIKSQLQQQAQKYKEELNLIREFELLKYNPATPDFSWRAFNEKLILLRH